MYNRSQKHQHIRFGDDDENEEEDTEVNQPQKSHESTKEEITIRIIKQPDEESFGFELKGAELKRGENFVDNVNVNSPAYRANLLVGDRVIKVNSYRVSQMNITELFSLLEYETGLNSQTLDLVVSRQNSSKRNIENEPNEQTTIREIEEMEEMAKKKQKKSQEPVKNPSMFVEPSKMSKLEMENFVPASLLERTYTQTNAASPATPTVNNINRVASPPPKQQPPPQVFGDEEVWEEEYESEEKREAAAAAVKSQEQQRAEAIEQVKFTAQRITRRSNVPSRAMLNAKCRELQAMLSQQGKYVTWQELVYELLQRYEGCKNIGDLGYLQCDHLDAIAELLRVQRRIDTLIIACEFRMPFIALLDLEQLICGDYNYYMNNMASRQPQNSRTLKPEAPTKVTKFSDLNVGPLLKNQLVRQIMRIPDDVTSIRQLKPISGVDLCRHLVNYLRENELWSKKVKESEFEVYLLEKTKVKNAWMLGYRIANIGNLIGALKSIQHLYAESMREIRTQLGDEMKVTFENEKRWIVKQLNDRFTSVKDPSAQTSLKFLEVDSIDFVDGFIGLFKKMLNPEEFKFVEDFLLVLKESVYLRDCFQLAICLGKHELDPCLNDIESNMKLNVDGFLQKYRSLLRRLFFAYIDSIPRMSQGLIRGFFGRYLANNGLKLVTLGYTKFDGNDFDDDQDEAITIDSSSSEDDYLQSSPKNKETPSLVDCTSRLLDLVESKLEPNKPITFEHLAKLEGLIYGQASYKYAELLHTNRNAFEKRGIKVELNEYTDKNADKAKIIDDPLINEHLEQLKHCLGQFECFKDEAKKKSALERIVSDYYGVEFNSDCLGSNKRDSSLLVAYENALVFDVDDKKSMLSANEKRSRLLVDIVECPPLCELNEYLNWRVEYAPVLGGLKDYLVQNPVDVALYEIEPGKLLKVNSNSDIESLKASIESGDAVGASSHLVSIIAVKYRGLASAPLALIANEIQSSFSVLLKNSTASSTQFEDRLNELYDMFVSKSAIDSDDEEVRPPRLIARFMGFVSLMIEKITFRLATRILFPLILDPVVKLTSNHGFKKQLFEFVVIREMLYRPEMLNDVSKTIQSFVHLGQSCAIKEWSNESLRIIREILSSKAQEEIVAPTLAVDKNQEEKTNPVERNHSNEITPIKQAIKPIQVAVVHPLNEKGQQFAHIQSIRQRYGIGVELDDQSRAVADSLKGVISRSLETLSNELYNKDMHFVLELIQNSDDNTYPEEGQIAPTLAFLIEPHKITLLNNELGFGAANINAICDVKASTKGKHARGYIGRKGIGFKSVFTITNRPQIHSNGYHFEFCLDEKEKGSSLGYIMPNWIEISEEMRSDLDGKKAMAIEALNDDEHKSVCDLETIIELPLKSHSEMQRHKSSLLTNNFNDIKPNILLFLNRLRNLVIINTETKSKLVYRRTDLDPTLVELSVIRTNSSGAVSKHHHKWLVARRTLQLPDNLKPSDDVDATDLCLAFPISDSNSTHIKQQKMDVFAFLPLRSFGFKFIIQADFVVPASRQDLNQDSPWNQWIVNHLPALFVQSLHLFREKFEPIEAVKAYLRFVPLEDEIVGFFQHIPRQVAELLRQEAFLPAVDANMEIVWRKPFECVLIKDDSAAIQEVLTSDLLQTYLGRYYLHPALLSPDEAHLKSLLIQLGVHQLDLSDIVDILKSALLSTTAANFDSATTAKWLVVLYHCFNSANQYSMQQEELFLDQLKQLEFIPVTQFDYETKSYVKKLVSLSQQSVFLRPSESKKTTKTLNKDKIDTLIEQDLCLLDVDTLLCLDELKNAQIISVLTSHLSVRLTTSPSDIIEHHIMRQLGCSTTKPEEVLIGYAVYLSWYSQWNLIDSDRLRAKLPLKTSLGFKILSETSPIIITPIYGSRLDLQHLFPSYSQENRLCGFIDDIYMRKSIEMIKSSSAKLADIWHRFWVNLGLSDGLAPRLVQISLDQVDLDAHKQFSQYKDRLEKLNDGEVYVFKDYQFDLIDFYVDYVKKHFDETLTISNRDIIKELTNLYRFIEENWNSANTNKNLEKKFNSCRSISVFKRDSASDDKLVTGEKLINDNLCGSTFFDALKGEKWILAECNRYQVIHKTKVELITEIRAKRADEVFLKEHVFTQLYGLHVPYVLNAPYRDKSTLSVDLDFKSEFSMSEFVDTFESWTVSKSTCCFTLDQMRHIYTFISNYTRSHSNYDPLVARLSDLSRSKPFIFIPVEREVGSGETRPHLGQFYSSNSAKLFWKDPSGLFAKYGNVDDTATETARFIGGVYGERMREVFVDEFQLTETPPIADYVALLEHVCFLADTGKSPFSSDETLSDVFLLYECLVDKCVELSAQLTDIDLAAPLKQQVSSSVLSHLQNILSTKCIIACYQKNRLKWQSASQSNPPCLADAELDLAEKFSEKINIAVVNVASQQHIAETDDDDAFVKSCRFETDTMRPKLLFFWLEVLQLSSFSSLVILDLENITECLREAPVSVQNRCRRLVPLVQCFLASRADCRPIYERLKALDMKEKLERLKIYSVKELQNIYRFKHESGIYCQVSNRTCLDLSSTNWKFYIRADVLESAKDVIRGFIRLFTRLDGLLMSESCAKDLLAFCMIMQQFDLSSSSSSDSPIRLNDEDRREIERDYRVKLILPAGEVKWKLRDLQPEWTNNATLEEGEIDEKDPMIMRANRPVRNQAYQANNGPSKREMLYELERISSNQMMLPPAYGPDDSNPIPHHQYHQNQHHNNQIYANMNRQNSYNNTQTGQSNLRGDLNNPSQSTQVSLRRASFVELPNKEETEANNVDTFDFDVRPKIAQSVLDSLASMSRFNDMSQNDQQFLFMIGRWGEMWVNEALKSRYQSEIASDEIKIEWMNETAESGLPYDIRIINRKGKNSSEANFASSTSEMDSTANEDQVIAYIEVKSTRKTEQESFPISYQEILFAQKNQAKFEIYRVYGAGMNKSPTDEQPIRVKIFRNVPRLLNSHKLNLFIVI